MTGMLPVIEIAFDPTLRLADVALRLQAVVIGSGALLALVVAALRARAGDVSDGSPLRRDDLLYITLGAIPGAFVAARLVHGLAYHETYLVDPARVLDVSVGSFSLSGAVIGGVLAGVYIATLLEGATRRWADVAAVPLLVAIGIGKVGQFLGGGGQGAFWEGPWAVAFTGAGPWTSAAAAVPAHPVALYEAVWYLAGIPVVVWGSSRLGAWWSPVHGSGLGIAVCWFLGGRALLGTFWRDDPIVGPFNVEQAVATVALGVIVAVSIQRALRRDARLRAAERAGLVPPRQPHG